MKVLHSPVQFCLHFLRQSYFRLAIPCFTRGAGRTAIAVDAKRWFNWHSSLLWRLMTSSVDLSTVAQSSFFSLVERSVSSLMIWFQYPKIVYSDMVQVLNFYDLSENLDSERNVSEFPLEVSVPPLRKPLAEYRPEKWSVVHTILSTDKWEFSSTLWKSLGLVPDRSRGKK